MENSSNVLLSICLPTYNRAAHIKRQLSFIVEEALPYLGARIEVLVSNNASTDNTDFEIKNIQKMGRFFYFIQAENLGALRNMHYLVKNATGKYVWIVGDDDILKPGIVERVIGLLEQHQKERLGAVFLGTIDDCARENLIDGIVQWESIEPQGERFGLMRYERENTKIYEFDGPFGDLLFITRSIVLKEAWSQVATIAAYDNLETAPFAAHLLAIRDRTFYVDKQVSVYMTMAQNTWSSKAAEVASIQMLRCFLCLRYLGFSKNEMRQIIIAYLGNARTWIYPFHPKLCFNFKVIVGFSWMIVKNGYLFPFLEGLGRGFFRYLGNRLRIGNAYPIK